MEKEFEQLKEASVQASLLKLKKAEDFIRRSLKGIVRGSFAIELPIAVKKEIENISNQNIPSHSIPANSLIHGKKNHGLFGIKNTPKSIPLRDEDFLLIPYIMVAPDDIKQGSTDKDNRKSIRFYKELSNGYGVVVEKEKRNSPNAMETITIWAEMSSKVADARQNTSPAIDVRNVILDTDVAKIHKDAENAIRRDVQERTDEFLLRKTLPRQQKKRGITL